MQTIDIENAGGSEPAIGKHCVNVFPSSSSGCVALFVNTDTVSGCQLTPTEARRIAEALWECSVKAQFNLDKREVR